MAKSGLKKWFSEKWVDIGSPKKNGKYQRSYYNDCFLFLKAETDNMDYILDTNVVVLLIRNRNFET